MLKKSLIILSAFVVGSCYNPSPEPEPTAVVTPETIRYTGPDGYSFGSPEYVQHQFVTYVKVHKTREELRQAAKEKGMAYVPDLAAFSYSGEVDGVPVCIVHVMDPHTIYEPEFIGHEFTHCMYGQWHTDNNTRQ